MLFDYWFRLIIKIKKFFNYRRYICKENNLNNTQTNDNDLLFSIVVPVYKTPSKYLKGMIDSIISQSYKKWELILADAGGEGQTYSKNSDIISEYKDSRINYLLLKRNNGISANTNEAIKRITGDWIVFVDHDDILAKNALMDIYQGIKNNFDCGYVYTDEDKVNASGRKRYDPYFKPEYNPDLLCGMNYISHLSAVKKTVLDKVGMLDQDKDGSQDYDLTLRCSELLRADQIVHIPEILYHWRSAAGSTAKKQNNKMYAYEAGRKAVQDHIERLGIPGTVEELQLHGRYRIHYKWDLKPFISVIIFGDHEESVEKSIQVHTDYYNYEIVPGANIDTARGDYILFVDSNIRIINDEWMSEMIDICQRKDVGVVGAEIIYKKNRIWHAGINIDEKGDLNYIFRGYPSNNPGYMGELLVCKDYDAVSDKCMLVRRELVMENKMKCNGDICKLAKERGFKVVFTPFAKVYYKE